jgi:hypothetical protein
MADTKVFYKEYVSERDDMLICRRQVLYVKSGRVKSDEKRHLSLDDLRKLVWELPLGKNTLFADEDEQKVVGIR